MNNKWIISINFCIIDPSKIYPLSYVCGLSGRRFDELFNAVDKVQFSLSLLNEALENPEYSSDIDIKAKIEKRIKILTPKTSMRICRACGSPFSQKSKFHQLCKKCKSTLFKPETANCGLCGSLFEVHGKQKICKDCRKEHKTQKPTKQENTYYTSKKNLGFVSKAVIEKFKEEGLVNEFT